MQHRHFWLRDEPKGRYFQPAASQIVTQRFPHPGQEQPMEMKRREMRDLRQRAQFQRLIQMLINMFEHLVRPSCVFSVVVLQYHELPNVFPDKNRIRYIAIFA